MFGILKNVAAVICLIIQLTIIILYGFTGIQISQYMCLMIWLICGVLEVTLLDKRHAI